MAKLVLIFICVFLMVQLSTPNPLVRSHQQKEFGPDVNPMESIKGMMTEVMKMTDPKIAMQLSLAARIVRDAPDSTQTVSTDSNTFNINELLTQFTQGIQKVLSKESIDKFVENVGETGEKLKEFGQGLIDKAQEKASEIAHGKVENQ